MYQNIIYSAENQIASVTLNRPEKMNSLDEQMISDLREIFLKIDSSPDIRTVIIQGAGGNFCSGLYLDYLKKISEYNLEENLKDSESFKEMILSIYKCSKPVIAKVSGYALAGGCGIATACDFIIADETAKFGYPEGKIGFIPAVVMIFLLKRISEAVAKQMILTGEIISAEESLKIGLINKVVPANKIDSAIEELIQPLMKSFSSSLKLTKEMFFSLSNMNLNEALEYACKVNAETRLTDDCKAGVKKFLNKNK